MAYTIEIKASGPADFKNSMVTVGAKNATDFGPVLRHTGATASRLRARLGTDIFSANITVTDAGPLNLTDDELEKGVQECVYRSLADHITRGVLVIKKGAVVQTAADMYALI